MIKKLLGVLWLFNFAVYAQTSTAEFVPTSPEAAALGKWISYPVNFNTGVPNINIPFYEVEAGDLKCPVVLNYHAGGFKINEKSGRTGLGWSLSTDIQISRSINGKDDLDPYGGYLDNALLKSHKSDNSNSYPFYTSGAEFPLGNAYDIAAGTKDGMPDKFNYKLLNKSGSFYFQKSNFGTGYSIVPVPYDNIRINYSESEGIFTIVDTDGTTYSFGVPGIISETNLTTVKKEISGNNNKITTWKCDFIESAKGEIISFNYVEKNPQQYNTYADKIEYYSSTGPCEVSPYYGSNEYPLSNQTDYDYLNVPFYQISSPKYKEYFWNKMKFHVPYINSSGDVIDKIFTSDVENSRSMTIVRGIALSEIIFPGGKVVFTGADKLSLIKVYDHNNSPLKDLRLFQSEYTNGSFNEKTSYLDSLHIANATPKQRRYVLHYNNKFNFGNHLTGQDLWGGKNQKTRIIDIYGNTTMQIPHQTITDKFYDPAYDGSCNFYDIADLEIGGDDPWAETPDRISSQDGMLRRIIFPAGGYVDFDYENNQYMAELEGATYSEKVPQTGGGLRIRTITSFDENGDLASQKYYRYGQTEEGTGILLANPSIDKTSGHSNFGIENYSQKISYLETDEPSYNMDYVIHHTEEIRTTYQSASSLDYTYPGGAPIYYTKVTEYHQDFGEQTGRTVYEYVDPREFEETYSYLTDSLLVPGTNIPYLRVNWMRGVQKSVAQYSYNPSSGYQLKNRKSFEYNPYTRADRVKVVNAFFKTIYEIAIGTYEDGTTKDLYKDINSSYRDFVLSEYGLTIGKLLLSKEKQEVFEDGVLKADSTLYYYDRLPFLNPSRIISRNSDGHQIEKQLKYSYDFNGIYDAMESANMTSQVLETIITNNSTSTEISRQKVNYHLPTGRDFMVPNTFQSSTRGEPLETNITYNSYDVYGNVLETVDKVGVPTSYLWGYKRQYPVAQLQGISYNSIPSVYRSNSQLDDPTSEASIQNVLMNLKTHFSGDECLISTFTYKPLMGPASITFPNNDKTSFDYDSTGRLNSEKDKFGNLLTSYDYHVADYKDRYYDFYNAPVMRTINYDCNTGLQENYIVPGGSLYYYAANFVQEYAESVANSAAENEYNPFNECASVAAQVASLEFGSSFLDINGTYANYPNNIWVDILRDGSIVATQKINSKDIYDAPANTKLLLPEGTYQLSFRLNDDVKYQLAFIPDFSIVTNGNTGSPVYIDNGETVFLDASNTYSIRIHNYR